MVIIMSCSHSRQRHRLALSLALLLSPTLAYAATTSTDAHAPVREANTLVPTKVIRYAPTAFPDRIVLLPGEQPEHAQTISWRTHAKVDDSMVQITEAGASPGLHLTAHEHHGSYTAHSTSNGDAHHHRVHLTDLTPDTLYAYRVKGDDTWSEWLQFRTPKADFAPYTALYFGDGQNALLSHYARTVREAFRHAPQAKVMLYAGDLVNSRYGVHDDEWGEWFQALSWMGGSVTQIPSSGNHEFSSDDNDATRHILPHWKAQFALPDNGPKGLTATVYYTDYQGVRYIALDSTEAMQSPAKARQQAEWLEQVLANNPQQWTIVIHHHPLHSVSRGRDNPPLREHWQPIYEKYNVDVVLQGHDHTYGRTRAAAEDGAQGPMYTVTVAGPKMYLVSEQAKQQMARYAEDTQLYQTLDFTEQQLTYRSYTASGELYDGFTIHKNADGSKQVTDEQPDTAPRLCGDHPRTKASRCWNGTDLIYAPAGNHP